MENILFYVKDAVFFKDTLKEEQSYIAKRPRNHESLFVVTKGNLLYEKNGKRTVIPEGSIGYIEKGSCDVSGAYMCDEVSYIATNFFFGDVEDGTRGVLPFRTLCAENSLRFPYKSLFEKAPIRHTSDDIGSNYVAIGILLEIIGYLYFEYEHSHQGNECSKNNKIVNDAISYMYENFHNPDFKVGEFADLFGMSEKNFRRIFKNSYKQTPFNVLQRIRIERGKFLLKNTYKSVSEIALSCGFADVYSFSHCFKRLEGFSPTEYRDERNATSTDKQVNG